MPRGRVCAAIETERSFCFMKNLLKAAMKNYAEMCVLQYRINKLG